MIYIQITCLMITTLCTVFWIINQYFFYKIFKKFIEKETHTDFIYRCVLENIENKKIEHEKKLNLDLKNIDYKN